MNTMLGTTIVAAALACVVGCSGENGQNGASGAAVTLTGCLQPGDSPNTFRLMSNGSPNSEVGTSGSQSADRNNPTGTSSKSGSSDVGAPTTKIYTLIPTSNVDLSKDQGSIVSVTGRFENMNRNQNQNATGTSGSNDQNLQNQRDRRPGDYDKTSPPSRNDQQSQGTSGERGNRPQGTGTNANPATGEGPQSSVHGEAANRPSDTLRVDSVARVAGSCSAGGGR